MAISPGLMNRLKSNIFPPIPKPSSKKPTRFRTNSILSVESVDSQSGIIYTGPTISLKIRPEDARRIGLTAAAIGNEVNIAMLGQIASTVLDGDRIINIRVKADPGAIDRIDTLRQISTTPLADGTIVRLDQVADVVLEPGQLELHCDDLRENISVTAKSAKSRSRLGDDGCEIAHFQRPRIVARQYRIWRFIRAAARVFQEFLEVVLLTALALVFLVALIEFQSLREPIAIVSGAALAALGVVLSLLLTHSTLNIVAYLGRAIIGMGIVHKNGLLMLDAVKALTDSGTPLMEALIQAGRRRLRPVLMTSLAAGLGMLPLAVGESGADMLKPLAFTIIGAVCISVLLSLVATLTIYYVLRKPMGK